MAYYNITSSSQLIDVATISTGCSQIEAAAEKFIKCADLIDSAASICDANALSVDKTTMQPQLEADADYIRSMKDAADSFATAIRNVASQVYAAQSNELNNYIAEQEALKQQAANSNTN